MKKLVITQKAIKGLTKAGHSNFPRLRKAINELAQAPESKSNNIIQLKGREEFRLRVGDWRIFFNQAPDTITILDVRRRNEKTYK